MAIVAKPIHNEPPGLTGAEAEIRLQRDGPNEPQSRVRYAWWQQLLHLFLNPLVIILLVASGITAGTGDTVDAAIIASIILLSIALNFAQTFRSQKAAEALRASVAPTAMVLRDGKWSQIQRRLLVVGDVVRLSAGDMIPADAELIEARDLHVQQAALTGESMPVEKEANRPRYSAAFANRCP